MIAVQQPPSGFLYGIVQCPSCDHGIDTHGRVTLEHGQCEVLDENETMCQCKWTPNDIAGELIANAKNAVRTRVIWPDRGSSNGA